MNAYIQIYTRMWLHELMWICLSSLHCKAKIFEFSAMKSKTGKKHHIHFHESLETRGYETCCKSAIICRANWRTHLRCAVNTLAESEYTQLLNMFPCYHLCIPTRTRHNDYSMVHKNRVESDEFNGNDSFFYIHCRFIWCDVPDLIDAFQEKQG